MHSTIRHSLMIATALLLPASAGAAGQAAEEAEPKGAAGTGSVIHVERFVHEDDAYLGVSLARVEHLEGTDRDGLYITRVHEGTGAEAAGLRDHDRLLSVDGKPVRDHGEVRRATSGKDRGDVVEVVVLRGGDEMAFDVTLGGLPERAARPKGPHAVLELQKGGRPMIGVRAITLTEQLAGFHEVPGGVLVTEVVEDSPAWLAGIRAGDVVVRWNGEEILSMGDIHSRLGRSKAGDVAEIELIRRGSVQQHAVTLATAEEVRGTSLQIRFTDEQAEKLGLTGERSRDDGN